MMIKYKYHLDIRLDGRIYFLIYQHGVPHAIEVTDNYDTEGEAIRAAKEIIRKLHIKLDEP